jgi:uncharacterized membrane protein YqaE (UPF0057 family)
MTGAINAAQRQVANETVGKVLGTIIGLAFATFFLPFVAVYAWNGMTPEGWVDLAYRPTVAGFFVFRVLLHWVRTE